MHYEGFTSYVLKKSYSEAHRKILLLFSKKMRFYTHFFTHKELGKHKDKFSGDCYYKTIRVICNYFETLHEDNELVMKELRKIRKNFPKPSSQPDIYTPTDDEIAETLRYLKQTNDALYRFYIGLMSSGVRIVEMADYINNKSQFKVVKKDDFQKVIYNKTRGKKSLYYIYLPLDYKPPVSISTKYLRTYMMKHKNVIRPKYMRNWFYSKCVELGISTAIADFYQGRSAISIGNKHYLEKEKHADRSYRKINGLLQKIFRKPL